MNHLNIISIRNAKFDEYFGFKVDEVQQMCYYYDVDDTYRTVQEWYDSMLSGRQTSILVECDTVY